LTPSGQAGAWHLLPVHTPLAQSEAAAHVLPVPHRLQLSAPPQSWSVSLPFLTLSPHVGVWHTREAQTSPVQSAATLHFFPAGHAGHALPPQSRSDSVPFKRPSLQPGAAHTLLAAQYPLEQSAVAEQALPFAHLLGQVLPQSTSVSEPFFTPSEHDAA
jgi:hypothetical protein